MSGRAYIFINYKQAARFGHIGWGFSLDDGSVFFGSTDHLYRHKWWDLYGWIKYMFVPPAQHTDWWAEIGSEASMLETMKAGHHIRYHAYKIITVDHPSPDRARQAAESMKLAGWTVLGNNCIDQAYRIVQDFGGAHQLPAPYGAVAHLIPRKWFAAIESESRYL